MSLVFYHAPMSTAVVTEVVLAELDVPHERVPVDIAAGETRQPAFLAINPNGHVPVIVHEGTAIWESAAITMYLGETFGVARGLYPELGPQRGEAMRWIVWANIVLAEAGSRLAATLDGPGAAEPGSRDWLPPEARSRAAGGKAKDDLAKGLGVLNGALAGRDFLLGDYTLADTHVQAFVGWLGMMQVDLAPHAAVGAWLARCMARPALARG